VAFGGHPVLQAGYAKYVEWMNALITPKEIALNRFVESPFAHPSVMFRRGLFEEYGAYREGPFPEDYELWMRWMANGVKMGKVDEELLIWNDPPQRLSRSDPRYSMEAFYRIKSEYLSMWLAKNNPHHPDVIVWGAGRVTRKRADILKEFGIRVTHCIDLKARALNCGTPVLHHNDIPAPDSCFILPMLGNRGARDKVRAFLNRMNYREGIHYLCFS